MDTLPIEAFSKNGNSGSWMITCGREVVLTLVELYYVGRGRVVRITCREPILVRIVLLDTSPAIQGTRLLFFDKGFELLSDCVGEELIWEAQYLRLYFATMSDNDGDVGGLPILVLADEKPINNFLTFKQGMKVAFFVCDDTRSQCARLGFINKCSP